MTDRTKQTWNELVDDADRGMAGRGAVIEAARRFTESTEKYSRLLVWLTVVLVFLTVVIAVLTGLLWWRA